MLTIAHIHPMLVHFPIVFVLSLAILDTVATLRGVPVTGRGGIGNVSTGLALLSGLFAIGAYIFGDMALEFAEAGGFHNDVAEIHETLGEATAAAFALWAIVRIVGWWRNARLRGGSAVLLSLVELAGAGVVMATAYFGGQLVYDLGVNVAQAG
jgi:uncharacterized membrane protein